MRQPIHDMKIFKSRRQAIGAKIPGAALVLPANPDYFRNNDVHHYYRQDTNMFYLSGFEEQDSCLIYRPGKNPETVLFVRDKDIERETWDGFRYGPEGAVEFFGVDKAYSINQFEDIAPELLMDVDRVYYSMLKNHEFDKTMMSVLKKTTAKGGRSGRGVLPVEDSYPLIGEFRLIKDDYDGEQLSIACQITAEAHIEVMKATRPGMNERTLYGLFIKEIMQRGSDREGYRGIVAGGNNATTLHYVFNDQLLKDGDLLLVDCGGEHNYYTGDITRTYPVNGKFSAPQKRLYEKVLTVQKQLLAMVKPGVPFDEFQNVTVDYLTGVMIEEKLLKGNKEELIRSMAYKKYYPHGVSHYLGMDVHDAGKLKINGKARLLEEGMAFTVEPGIYIPAGDMSAPAELRGIGIRIEDDVLVTGQSGLVMTAVAPKEVEELEALIGRS